MPSIITVENLGKKYLLTHQRQPYVALRDVIADNCKSLGSMLAAPFMRHGTSPRTVTLENFWALRDVSFEVQQGDRIGIIGRNGAGKSTLLKILSRITEPTTGSVRIKGRVASLLEVGTGFHPELTGRENIYLNGAILGMSRAEIRKKYDEIVEFAEIEKFLDTPVKRYSSGMYVRLAFAVAAHLEPEILLVDEVLAVGDVQFQKKCLGKMEDVSSKEGRTILFVSHNIATVRQLCNKSICLVNGQLNMYDKSDIVIHNYLEDIPRAEKYEVIATMISQLPPDPSIRLNNIIIKQNGCVTHTVVTGLPVEILIDYEVIKETHGLRVFFVLNDSEGTCLFRSFAHGDAHELPTMKPGRYISQATIPADFLAPITYEIGISASIYNVRRCFPQDINILLSVQDVGRLKNVYAHIGTIGFKIAPLIPWVTKIISSINNS